MDVRRQVAGLRSWLPLLIASAVLAGGLAYLASGLLPKVYEAKSTLLIGQSLSAVNPDFSQLQASQQLSNTYVKLATTRSVLVAVIDKLGLQEPYEDLVRRVQASTPINSTLLDITVTDPDRAAAAAIANEVAAQVIKASPDLQGQEEEIRKFVAADLAATQAQIESTQAEVSRLAALDTRTPAEDAQLNLLESRLTSLRASYSALLSFASNDASNLVTLFDPAVAPNDPVSPRPLVNTLLAAVLGLLLVMAIIVIATYFDDSVKSTEDVEEAAGLPTLGAIPRMPGQRGRSEIYQLATLLYPRSAAAEAYRTVRTNLDFASVDEPLQSLLVTSAGPGEGKSVTAANLAIAFAQAGRKVLLVDADLRKPGVHALFNLGNDRGLTNLLRGDDTRWGIGRPADRAGGPASADDRDPATEPGGAPRLAADAARAGEADRGARAADHRQPAAADRDRRGDPELGGERHRPGHRRQAHPARLRTPGSRSPDQGGCARARGAAQRAAAQGLPGLRWVLRDRGVGPVADVRHGELAAVRQVASRPIAPRMARSTSWTSNRSSAIRRLSRPIAASRSGSASISVMPSARDAASRAATSRPFLPGSTVPRQPGTSVVKTGRAMAMPSSSDRGSPPGRTAGRSRAPRRCAAGRLRPRRGTRPRRPRRSPRARGR